MTPDHLTSAGRQPVLGFVGIHAGRHVDRPVSQNETLARLFSTVGYRVRRTSAVRMPALRTAHQIASILWWRDVDLLVIAVFSARSFWIAEIATRLGRLTGKRMVLFLHGGSLPVFGPAHKEWVYRVFERADLILAPSDFLADTFREWGFDVRIIPNVLAIEQYEYAPRLEARHRLLWMRTFHEHYAPDMAVRVLARVAEVHPDVTMVMAGADQGLYDATRALARELGVEDRIEFPGYIDPAGKRRVFAENDIYLNTNIVDNMPVSLLEASASGLVTVATAVGGIPKMLHDGQDAILVPSGDDEAMADAVLGLMADPDRYAALSAAARELAERSAWPAVRRRWVAELSLLMPDMVLP